MNDRVRLISFNGTKQADPGCHPTEDYWKLIGSSGTVTQDPSQSSLRASFSPQPQPRVLVVFDANLDSMGLINHNPAPNSLWILESDLVPENSAEQMGAR